MDTNTLKINATIRKAKREDMVQVFELIKELAIFEKLEDQVQIDASVLQNDGFDSPNPAFHCIVAEMPNNLIVGYALYYIAYSTWSGKAVFLEDLYVQPQFRQNGIGSQLFLTVAKITHEMECTRMDFHVLSWNPARNFYEKLGAINLSETESWQLFRLNKDSLSRIFG